MKPRYKKIATEYWFEDIYTIRQTSKDGKTLFRRWIVDGIRQTTRFHRYLSDCRKEAKAWMQKNGWVLLKPHKDKEVWGKP